MICWFVHQSKRLSKSTPVKSVPNGTDVSAVPIE